MGSDNGSRLGIRDRLSHRLSRSFERKKNTSRIESSSQEPSREPSQAPSSGSSQRPSQTLLGSAKTLDTNAPSNGDLLKIRDSEITANQKRDLSKIKQGHDVDLMVVTNKDLSKDLWANAYKILGDRNPDLIEHYDQYLKDNNDFTVAGFSSSSPEVIETTIKSKLKDREDKKLTVSLGNTKKIHIREQGEKVVKFILWSNGIISDAVSSQPYVALAWSGISILINVCCAMMFVLTSKC